MSQMWVSRWHIGLSMAPGLVCQFATRWPLHLVKGEFQPWIFQKLPQKCNFDCYLCQGFHWLGPDLGSSGRQMWSSTILTMRWFHAVDTSRFTCSRTQKRQFHAVDKEELKFFNLSTFTTCTEMHFWAKISFGGSFGLPNNPGGQFWAEASQQHLTYWKA